MTTSFRFAATSAKLMLLSGLVLAIGCKKITDPTPNNLTSLQGSWKITGLTVNPAFLGFSDLYAALQLQKETCVNDAVVTFNASGTITNNLAAQANCTTAAAPNTQRLFNTFFGAATTYKEANNTVTLTTSGQAVTGTEVFTVTTVAVTAKLPTDPNGAAVPTTYVITMTKL